MSSQKEEKRNFVYISDQARAPILSPFFSLTRALRTPATRYNDINRCV